MHTGPLQPVSKEAITAFDQISKILKKTPRSEWEFVLLVAKEKAESELSKTT